MSLSGRVFAALYDPLMAGTEKAGLADRRRRLLEHAHGRVLEIGGGTGANLPYYGESVDEVVFVEPEEPMARRLERKLATGSLHAQVVRATAEALPFKDGSFDVVVSTLVLCTVADQKRALAEIHRVLKPSGRLLFLEHVRSDDAKLARWQDRLAGLNRRLGHGCNCNRDTLAAITAADFEVADVERDRLRKAPPIVRPLVVGVAERVAA
ncbi:MAG: class I SAM-dependent methyltransferase [Actinobacteria bacterium]|nr:class I SAM-dependent methyltransferase [Actinomycetota bacterium]